MGAALPIAVGAQIAGGAYSAYGQSQLGRAQGAYYDYLSATSKQNAALANAGIVANREAIGAQEADATRRLGVNVRKTIGAQKAALAAGGAGASSRTAQDLIGDTENQGNLDEQALRYNADMRAKAAVIGGENTALGYESQATSEEMGGQNARLASKINTVGTILGTAGSVASSWYRMPYYMGYGGYGGGY